MTSHSISMHVSEARSQALIQLYVACSTKSDEKLDESLGSRL